MGSSSGRARCEGRAAPVTFPGQDSRPAAAAVDALPVQGKREARVDEVITALRELCRGRTAGKIRTHLNYFLKNRHRFAYTTMVGLGLPRGSGAVESAIRRVINLRIKGASIYWLPESVDAILLLRSFYKSGRWNCLQRMAMTPVGVSA